MREVDLATFAAAHRSGATLIDVREPFEYVAGHVPDARLVPICRLAQHLAELLRTGPVYVICASGNRSLAAADYLARAGVDAWSVAGGTGAWKRAGFPVVGGAHTVPGPVTAQGPAQPRAAGKGPAVPRILAIDTPTLGDRGYLVHDGRVAFVVDPQRDIDRVLDLATGEGVRITHVFETHIHNDYITGGYALAAQIGAAYHVNADDPVSFDRVGVRDGAIIAVGESMRLRVRATPGHTFTHLSYLVEADGRDVAVFTGGSLLYGSVGRPDLLGPAHTETLVHHQYASANCLAAELPDGAGVYPTHGFGSFCSATQSEATASTIGREKRVNPALTQPERQFVDELLAGLDAWPAYYAHMAPANSAGPAAPDLSAPERADADQIRKRLAAGEWVVDLRNRAAYAASHVAGTLNFGLDGNFATYLGWLIPWGTPVTLLGETAEQVTEAQRELVRIGIDRPAAHAIGDPVDWSGGADPASFPRAMFADLTEVRHHRPVVVLDVRRNLEWAEARIDGAVHIPLHDLLNRLHEIPDGEVWVHCAAGYRASIAASILAAAGRWVVAVDDEFDRAPSAGVATAPGA